MTLYRLDTQDDLVAPTLVAAFDSWIDAGLNRCFQLMECDDLALLQRWVAAWEDLTQFEIVPVTPSAVTAEAVTSA